MYKNYKNSLNKKTLSKSSQNTNKKAQTIEKKKPEWNSILTNTDKYKLSASEFVNKNNASHIFNICIQKFNKRFKKRQALLVNTNSKRKKSGIKGKKSFKKESSMKKL